MTLYTPHGKFGKKNFDDFFSTEKFALAIWEINYFREIF